MSFIRNGSQIVQRHRVNGIGVTTKVPTHTHVDTYVRARASQRRKRASVIPLEFWWNAEDSLIDGESILPSGRVWCSSQLRDEKLLKTGKLREKLEESRGTRCRLFIGLLLPRCNFISQFYLPDNTLQDIDNVSRERNLLDKI